MNGFGTDPTQYFIRLRGQVKGPYSIEQLGRMAGRGQFSRLHQVSMDQYTWNSAAEMTAVFPSKAGAGQEASVLSSAPVAAREWYYNTGDCKVGPVDEAFIKSLIVQGSISRETLVWKVGLPNWLEARQFFPNAFGAPGIATGKWTALVAGIVVLVVAAGGGIWLFRPVTPAAAAKVDQTRPDNAAAVLANAPSGTTAARVPAVPPISVPPLAITSTDLSNEAVNAAINEATGMVVSYLSIDLTTGEHHELCLGHGTCFTVTADGSALTNKHVIEDHQVFLKSTREGRISRLSSQLKSIYGLQRDAEGRIVLDKDGQPRADPAMETEIDGHGRKIARIEPVLVTYFAGKGFPSELIYASRRFDMAVLKIDRPESAFFALGSRSTTAKLSAVLALGFPGIAQEALTEEERAIVKARKRPTSDAELLFGKESHRDGYKSSAFELTPTPGEISVVQEESGGIYNAQHTAPIRQGNSGGPLVFRNGADSGVAYGINTSFLKHDSPVFVAFPVAQMRDELEGEAGLAGLTWR